LLQLLLGLLLLEFIKFEFTSADQFLLLNVIQCLAVLQYILV